MRAAGVASTACSSPASSSRQNGGNARSSTARTAARSAARDRRVGTPGSGTSARSWCNRCRRSCTENPASTNGRVSAGASALVTTRCVAPAPQRAQPLVDQRLARRSLRADGEIRDVGSAVPGAETGPTAGPAQHVVGHRRGRLRGATGGFRVAVPFPSMLLIATDPVFEEHDTGPHHPERPSRLARGRGRGDPRRPRFGPGEPRPAGRDPDRAGAGPSGGPSRPARGGV